MKVSELTAFLVAHCDGDEEIMIWHSRRESPALDVKLMGGCTATVEEGGRVCLTDEMRAKAAPVLCIMAKGWDGE